MAQHTVIAHQTHVKGTLRGDQPVEVRGLLEGHVQLEEVLTVAQEGQVIAQVQVREAIIHGLMRGQLKASERIIITASARVEGTIEAPIIRVDDGARVRGEVVMDVEGDSPVVKPSTVRAPAQPSQTAPARSWTPSPAATPAKVEAPAPPAKAPEAPKAQEVEAQVEAQVGAFTSPARQGASAAAAAAAAARAPRTSSNVATISAPEPAQEPTQEAAPEAQAPQDEPTPSEVTPEHEETEAFEEDHAEPETPREDEPAHDAEDDLDEEALDDEHRPAVNLSAEVLAEYDDYTVKELREALRRIDLPVSGTKTELIERLVEAKSQGQ